MARKRKQSVSIVSAIIVAVIIGLAIGAIMFNPAEEGVHVKPPERVEAYDPSWGLLETPIARGTVTHILISWDGAGGTPSEPRTREEARKLIEELWVKYRNDPTDENWRDLQARYNEDRANPHAEFEVYEGALLVPEFIEFGRSTEVNHARITDGGRFGYHLIRRER
jgi:hypothetical protein